MTDQLFASFGFLVAQNCVESAAHLFIVISKKVPARRTISRKDLQLKSPELWETPLLIEMHHSHRGDMLRLNFTAFKVAPQQAGSGCSATRKTKHLGPIDLAHFTWLFGPPNELNLGSSFSDLPSSVGTSKKNKPLWNQPVDSMCVRFPTEFSIPHPVRNTVASFGASSLP